jgi:hypothetical protein
MRSFFFAATAAAFLLAGCTDSSNTPTPSAPAPGGEKSASTPPAGEKPAGGVGSALGGAVDTAKAGASSAVSTAAAAMKLEIACAHCVYKKAGVTSCAPAVKVGEKVLLLSGVNVDPKASDLCTGPKQATIVGKAEGDKFVATKVDIAK